MSLTDPNVTPDPNQINNYINNVTLSQFSRIDFAAGVNSTSFRASLESALTNGSNFASNFDSLDKINLVTLGLLHNDHYHFPTCINMRLQQGVQQITLTNNH